MTVQEIKDRLQEVGLTPSKGMGQNYLADDQVCALIVDAVRPEEADLVLEIGPGLGALTETLAPRCRKLILVELEGRVAEWWGKRSGLETRRLDATKIDSREFFSEGDVRLIGNLPYSVATEIIRVLLDHPSPFSMAIFMVQREVAERLAAAPGQKAYSSLSLLVQQNWIVETVADVPPEAFFPEPRVHSRVLRFTPRDPATKSVYDPGHFRSVVRRGFSQRRKQMRKQFQAEHDWPFIVEALGIPSTARAEELGLEQWIQFSRLTQERPPKEEGQDADEEFDVVDERNEVIGVERREAVHRLGLRHRAVHVFLLREDAILLQRRSHLKDVAAMRWDSSAAGHLNRGEGYEGAARREVAEELGVEVEGGLELIGEIPASEETGQEFVRLFTLRAGDRAIRIDRSEIDCVVWFPLDDVARWAERRPEDFAPGFLSCLRLIR